MFESINELFKNKTFIIIITPLLLVMAFLLIYAYFFSSSPIIFFGKTFGKMSSLEFDSKEMKKLNLAYVRKRGMIINECTQVSKDVLKKLNYQNIEENEEFIRGKQKDNIALIRCTKYYTIPIAVYTKYKGTSKIIVDKIYYALLKNIENLKKDSGDTPPIRWKTWSNTNIDYTTCMNSFKKVLTNFDYQYKLYSDNTIYAKKRDSKVVISCFDNSQSIMGITALWDYDNKLKNEMRKIIESINQLYE